MSTKPLMLEGVLVEPSEADDGLLRKFRREKRQLEDDLRTVRQELDDVRTEKERLERSVRNLRQQLSPLFRGLRALFGEIELAVGEEQITANVSASAGGLAHPSADPRWESWKAKMPGRPAEMIDLLLLHKNMSTKALMTAMHCSKDTVYTAAKKLNGAALLATSQPYSLKELS